MNCIHLFQVYPEIFPVFSYDKTSQHSKWMDSLNVDWSSGWILSRFIGRERKIHKPKPWINQACKEIHTATLGMKLTSVVSKLENKINLSKSKVKLHPYSKSISTTTKGVIPPLFEIKMHHPMWNRPLLQIDMQHLPGLEPGAFRMETECSDHYTTSPWHYPHTVAGYNST